MTRTTKVYISVAVAVALLLALSSLVARLEIHGLEKQLEKATRTATTAEKAAAESETKAAEFREKIDYLEANLGEIRLAAKKQDEQLETISADTRNARSRVLDASRVRTIAATADELCEKLARVGHPCE
jgi:septal ring factor EnvC (AmiA/AmiB activator)